MRSSWPEKNPEEALVAEFSFANEIVEGETITGTLITCSVLSGTDASPAHTISTRWI